MILYASFGRGLNSSTGVRTLASILAKLVPPNSKLPAQRKIKRESARVAAAMSAKLLSLVPNTMIARPAVRQGDESMTEKGSRHATPTRCDFLASRGFSQLDIDRNQRQRRLADRADSPQREI